MASNTRVGLFLLLREWINKFSWNSQHQIQLIRLSGTELLQTDIRTHTATLKQLLQFFVVKAPRKKGNAYTWVQPSQAKSWLITNFVNEFCFQFISLLPITQSLFVRYRSLSAVYSPDMWHTPYLPQNATDQLQCLFRCISNQFINLTRFWSQLNYQLVYDTVSIMMLVVGLLVNDQFKWIFKAAIVA
jgi:hypothetical protein